MSHHIAKAPSAGISPPDATDQSACEWLLWLHDCGLLRICGGLLCYPEELLSGPHTYLGLCLCAQAQQLQQLCDDLPSVGLTPARAAE